MLRIHLLNKQLEEFEEVEDPLMRKIRYLDKLIDELAKGKSMDKILMKINIVGTTASGKTTFGKTLAEVIDAPFIEMDKVFWGPNWQEPPDIEFFKNLETALMPLSWVLDGNYSRTTPIKWKDVDTVVWLDYGFFRTLYQSITRAVSRAYRKTELWPNTGNYETFRRMFSSDSIVLWCLRKYTSNRIKFKSIIGDPKYSHINFVHLRSPNQARKYIETFTNQAG